MAKLIFFIVILASVTYASAQINELQPDSAATQLSTWLVDTVSQKIGSLARFFNVKLRLARFLVSLYTTENLMLFRNLLEYAVKLGNLTLKFLPLTTEDPNYWWIPIIAQLLNANVGSGGQVPNPDSAEAALETMDDVVTNPPIYFNAEITESNAIRESRSAIEETQYIDEKSPEVIEDDGPEDVLKTYEDRIMSLDKLIRARRNKVL